MGGEHLYIASCVPEGGIAHYIRIGETYERRGWLPCDRPMYMTLEGTRMEVLLRAPFPGSSRSGLVRLAVGANGALRPMGKATDTQGEVACHLCRWQGETCVANYLSGSVAMIGGPVHQRSGSGASLPRQDGPHPHFVGISPDGAYLLSTDLGLDTIDVHDRQLRVVSSVRTPEGCGPRHLAFSSDGRFVFCLGELTSLILVYAWQGGTLTKVACCPALRSGRPGGAAIRVRGDWVYTSHRGADRLALHRWTGERLIPAGEFDCGGKSPRDFVLAGNELLCANEDSDQVTILRVEDGRLSLTQRRISIRRPLCLVCLDADALRRTRRSETQAKEEEKHDIQLS